MKSGGWVRQTVFALATAAKINTKVTVAGPVCSTLAFGMPLNDSSKWCHLHWILDRGESNGACGSCLPTRLSSAFRVTLLSYPGMRRKHRARAFVLINPCPLVLLGFLQMTWLYFSYTWSILHSGDTPYSFIRSSVDGYLGWPHSSAVKEYYTTQKDSSMSSIYRLALLCLIPRSGMVWSCSHYTLGKHAHCCANLHSHHSYIRMSFSPHIFG